MKRTLFLIGMMLGLASAVHAAPSLTVSSDAAVYTVGDTITISVTMDDDGAATQAIFGQLVHDPLMTFQSRPVTGQLTSFGGFISWSVGALNAGAGFADAFNQIGGLNPLPVDQAPGFLISQMTFVAAAPGTVNVNFNATPGPFQLAFFGLTTAPGTSFNIVPIPEPTTAAMLGLGLLGLAVAGRRRA